MTTLRIPVETQAPTEQIPASEAVAPRVEFAALPPLLYDSADLCRLLRVARATLHRLLAAGKLPKPIKLAGLKWSAAEIEAFVTMGCPDRATFEVRRLHEMKRAGER